MTELNKRELYEFIAGQRYGVVATTHADGSSQSALVGIGVSADLQIYFDTLGDTRKAVNLRRDPRISIVIGWDNERSAQLEGVACEPKGAELAALKLVYYAAWPSGPARASWPAITWFAVTPVWIRFSDFNRSAGVVRELKL